MFVPSTFHMQSFDAKDENCEFHATLIYLVIWLLVSGIIWNKTITVICLFIVLITFLQDFIMALFAALRKGVLKNSTSLES